jgi:uncharacterized protein YndB with AHSA1/START domain
VIVASTTTLKVENAGDRDLLITRAFAAPRTTVFRALTTPALVKRWLLGPDGWTMPVCEIDLKPGGRFRYLWRKDNAEMGISGTYQEIVPPERIVHTEVFDDDWTAGESVVTTRLDETDGRTTMSMTVRYASPDSRATALASGMLEGMTATYERLDSLISEVEP